MNLELGVYPDIHDPKFYEKISLKKEFYDNRVDRGDRGDMGDMGDKRGVTGNCLQSHQQLLSNFINPLTQYSSILINHSTGTGKTMTAISIAENFKNDYKILVVVKNKLLVSNFKNELLYTCSNYYIRGNRSNGGNGGNRSNENIESALQKIKKHYSFITYKTLINKMALNRGNMGNHETINNINNTILIIDEVHNIGDNGYLSIMKLLRKSINVKVILLSATPVYDKISEIFEISNILNFNNPESILPIKRELISQGYIVKKNIRNKILNDNVEEITTFGVKKLVNAIRGKVSFLTTDISSFPSKLFIGSFIDSSDYSISKGAEFRVFKTIMSSFQSLVYNKTLNNESEKVNIKKDGLFKNSTDASLIVYPDSTFGKRAFTRNIVNNKNHNFLKKENINQYSSKLYSLLVNIDHSFGPCFIYSNDVNKGGIDVIKNVLIANGYSSRSGSNKRFVVLNNIKTHNRPKLLTMFNSIENKDGNLIKIIIGGPMITEGLTFKSIRQIHILDPHWNLSRIDQIIGRGVRFNSHSFLPVKDRNVEIYLYTALPIITGKSDSNKSIDLLKYNLAYKKDKNIKYIEYLLKTNAIDCALNKKRNNIRNINLNNSRECQYEKCNYKCPFNGNEIEMNDKKTYIDKLNIDTFNFRIHAPYEYKFIQKQIYTLFSLGIVYHIDYIIDYIQSQYKSIQKENIFIALYDLLDIPFTRETKSIGDEKEHDTGKVIIEYIGDDYYSLKNPETNENSSLQDKMYNRIMEKKDLKKLISYTDQKKTEKEIFEIIKNKSEISKIQKNGIYGSYLDKNGKKNSVFRIVENTSNPLQIDKRKIIYGKACSSFERKDLSVILDKLYSSFNLTSDNKKYHKKEYCKIIHDFLHKHDLIVL